MMLFGQDWLRAPGMSESEIALSESAVPEVYGWEGNTIECESYDDAF